MIKVDILMIKNKPVDSIGHNALASLIYFGTFWAFLLQSITGFGLYANCLLYTSPFYRDRQEPGKELPDGSAYYLERLTEG